MPEVSEPALLVMIHRLPDGQIQATALNFSSRQISGRAGSEHFGVGEQVIDLSTDRPIGQIGTDRTINISLSPHAGVSWLVTHRYSAPRPVRKGVEVGPPS